MPPYVIHDRLRRRSRRRSRRRNDTTTRQTPRRRTVKRGGKKQAATAYAPTYTYTKNIAPFASSKHVFRAGDIMIHRVIERHWFRKGLSKFGGTGVVHHLLELLCTYNHFVYTLGFIFNSHRKSAQDALCVQSPDMSWLLCNESASSECLYHYTTDLTTPFTYAQHLQQLRKAGSCIGKPREMTTAHAKLFNAIFAKLTAKDVGKSKRRVYQHVFAGKYAWFPQSTRNADNCHTLVRKCLDHPEQLLARLGFGR